MAIQKTCRQCQTHFIVANEDLIFYHKISPTFDGKTFEIPPPTLCPDCRQQRRSAFRNQRRLYKRKCDLCKREIISMYSLDKEISVYCQNCYWGDKWSASDFTQDLTQENIFRQIEKLRSKVPCRSVVNNKNQDSEYCNFSVYTKNCYLCFSAGQSEDCIYGETVLSSKSCLDCSYIEKCENCVNCVDCVSCYNCQHVRKCAYSSDCYISYDLKGCTNCLMCWNLKHKNYYVLNKPVSKEKFEKTLNDLRLSNRSNLKQELEKFEDKITKSAIHKFITQMNAVDSTGCYLINCENCEHCFDILAAKDCKYIFDSSNNIANCYDGTYLYLNTHFCYEVCSSSENYNTFFSIASWNSHDVYYCQDCDSCSDCFGCVGLRHKQRCILNKQYSKKEYEKKVAEIIEKMIGQHQWGEFFPISMSPFGYNETVAIDYYPISKSEAKKLGARWLDRNYDIKFEGKFYTPNDDIEEYAKNEKECNELLGSIIKCEKTGRPFKIMPQELAFCIEHKISLPTKHYDVRFKERMALRHKRKLYLRKCMNKGCGKDVESTYAPDRPETVYCEDCYQKAVI